MNEILKTAMQAARAAGDMLRTRLADERRIDFKGAIDLVTEMDRRSEALIVDILSNAFPSHAILAEESGEHPGSSDYRWIIDPLDGTTNYAHRFPHFAVSIGLEQAGRVVLGVVYDPMRDELFHATEGQGAHLNGVQVHVSDTSILLQSLLVTGFAYDRSKTDRNNLDHFANLLMRCRDLRRTGSASLDLCSVACGRFDGYWELGLKPWDVAAGSLIVTEAGGRVSDFSGTAFTLFDREILATNSRIHDLLKNILRDGHSAQDFVPDFPPPC